MRSATKTPLILESAKARSTSSHPLSDSDDSVAKIGAMFPTVSETHIKLLLKKYLNREALVISALQIEKYPITTPGPFSTPPPERNMYGGIKWPVYRAASPLMGALTGPKEFRCSPKPHSSPKLKLRYMKSVFPYADETIILECLQNNENSIQKTSEILREMGYSKKETLKLTPCKAESKAVENLETKAVTARTSSPGPKIKHCEDQQKTKEKLQGQYQDIPEHLISIALESVNFDESRAIQILQTMKQEDSDTHTNEKHKKAQETNSKVEPSVSGQTAQLPISQSRQSIKSLLKSEKKDDISTFSRIICDHGNGYRSRHLSNTMGHNPELSKGPNEKLLLENYVQWQSSNKSLQKGTQCLAKGPNKTLLLSKFYIPCGPNADIRKGPAFGLAKGSIFTHIKPVEVGEFGPRVK